MIKTVLINWFIMAVCAATVMGATAEEIAALKDREQFPREWIVARGFDSQSHFASQTHSDSRSRFN